MSRKPPKRKAKRDNSPAARQARLAVIKIKNAAAAAGADVRITINKDRSLRVHHVKGKTDDKDAIPQPAQDAGGRSS